MRTGWRVGWVLMGLLAWWPLSGYGQSALPWVFHGSATATGNGNAMQADYFSTVVVQIEGTFVGTVTFEKKTKDASGYVAVQCTNATDGEKAFESDVPGYWECPGGANSFRARVSAYTSGTIMVTGGGTTAVTGGRGGGGLSGLQANFNFQNEISSATSARPFIAGDGTRKGEFFGDPTRGFRFRPNPLGDVKWSIWPNFTGCFYDEEAEADILCIDPDAASPQLKIQYKPGYYPLKSVSISARSLIGDGTNCPTSPTLVTISNSSRYSHICTENNSSRRKFVIPMRPNWDGGVVYIKQYYSQTAADTGSVLLDVAAACRAPGTAFNGTYGTEINVDDAVLVGSGSIEATLSAAITPNGTCAAGDELFVYIDVDATSNPTTAAATLHFLDVELFWSETSLSH